MARKPDPCWETLVAQTGATPEFERGKLNIALRAIRAAAEREGLVIEDLPQEIERRAAAYRRMFPSCCLTPTALAKHWTRVVVQAGTSSTVEERTLARLRSANRSVLS